MPTDPLNHFHAPVAAWFRDVFAEPTVVQSQAWQAISQGNNTLVVAPTGSGKTLAAFLWSLSQLTSSKEVPQGRTKRAGTKVLYISPLKALGVDVDRNLAAPIAGISRMAAAMAEDVQEVKVGVRSGDTPQSERSRLLRNPPDILITTPESLYLMLTSKAAATLREVDTVIIDEVHAVAGTKRGTHLALSLERLEMIATNPVQRIGLSATVNPIDTVAAFLGGDRPVTVVNPRIAKDWDVQVRSVVSDFQDPPAAEIVDLSAGEDATEDHPGLADGQPVDEALIGPTLIGEGVGGSSANGSGQRVASGVDRESALPQQKSVWPHVQRAVYQQILDNRSTLVFVNSRRAAERLTSALNELWAEEHDPDSLAAPLRRDPAQLMAQSTTLRGAPAIIARAHHGSVSKEERAEIEDGLKSGQLRSVVATSSLELGIDMGLVDHVIQIGAPPSVSAAVQRCGRAGHSVGETSRATIYPLHKQDAEACTVIVDRMLAGDLEPLTPVKNALDVLAQHTIAVAAQAETVASISEEGSDNPSENPANLNVENWWSCVRRAHSYATLPREAFDGVIELVSGRYPSADFADLRPRVTYDPISGELTARRGAQRLAVTSGGTIPDRGMFGVFLSADSEDGETVGARRVGELDEEMVYESRVGDVFTLGASSWRIVDITRDQVQVVPAAGHTGRLPFWTGDAAGRPAELAASIGECRRHWGTGTTEDLSTRAFVDENTRSNLTAFYTEQKSSTRLMPDEKTIVVENFRDEIGDWRVIVHSPFGRGVNAPWAMAIGAQVQQETGMDVMPVAGDDGLVLRLPHTEDAPELSLGRAEVVLDSVMAHVGSSALFAGRFRECAARALLLPRRNPGKRQPLWQQRQRAAQLLDVAREHPEFPVMVEAMRECLHDVYDLDALTSVLEGIEQRRVRVAYVTTEGPSAFAEALLFRYTSAFMYEGDSAERAAALTVDPALLAKVLGKPGEGFIVDATVERSVVEAAQWLADGRRARTIDHVVDMLRALGPMTVEAISARSEIVGTDGGEVDGDELQAALAARVPVELAEVSFGGHRKWAVISDLPLLRDGLGVPVPPGVAAPTATVEDALEQLMMRWLRHRGPSTAREAAEEFGLGVATAASMLQRWAGERRVEAGTFLAEAAGGDTQAQPAETQYVEPGMLRRLRSATLTAASGALEPVSRATYVRFLQQWHGIGDTPREDLIGALEQLAGLSFAASAWETLILPARIPDYQPGDLDELLNTGEVIAVGDGAAGVQDSVLMLLPADLAPAILGGRAQRDDNGAQATANVDAVALSMVATQIANHVREGGAFLAQELCTATGADPSEVDQAIWELFDAGLLTPDSFAPFRSRMASAGPPGTSAHRAPRRDRGRGSTRRLRMGRGGFAQAARSPEMRARRQALNAHSNVPGRWSAPVPDSASLPAKEDVVAARSEGWLERYAVVTRGAILSEKSAGGFAETYRTLSAWEDVGLVLRGYIIQGLGGAQFAPRPVIDQLRRLDGEQYEDTSRSASAPILLAAADPVNPFGASLPWPELPGGEAVRPTRAAGAMLIIARDRPVAHLTRGGRSISLFSPSGTDLSFEDTDTTVASTPSPGDIRIVVETLSAAIRAGRLSPLVIERVNAASVMDAPTREWTSAGARFTPKGLSIR